mmetsp:Transcript_39874/g.58675  ORF Transcript_39874/g.58675 Transcript_39874/m.58675 type:complete len:309 (-) Transcript_39874:100-1026(-)
MTFFGTSVAPKQKTRLEIPDGQGLQLCGAAISGISSLGDNSFCSLQVRLNDQRFIICNLSKYTPQCALNQSFTAVDSPVELTVVGKGQIDLTGFWDADASRSGEDSDDEEEMHNRDEEHEQQQKNGAEDGAEPDDDPEDQLQNALEKKRKTKEEGQEPVDEPEEDDHGKKKKKKKLKRKQTEEEKKRDGIIVPESKIKGRNIKGMTVKDVIIGTGKTASQGQKVAVLYEVSSPDGEQYDRNWNQKKPLNFRIGVGEVIEGVEKGVVGMKVNGERMLRIPPELGYGQKRAGPIKPNSTLCFHIKLVSVG